MMTWKMWQKVRGIGLREGVVGPEDSGRGEGQRAQGGRSGGQRD
jgi:hypothetical protein